MISIIVPIYNEQYSVENTLSRIKKVMKGRKYESIDVNDCSTDRSSEIFQWIKGIKVVNHMRNKGYGAILKSGIREASGDWIMITDADGTYPIEEMPKLCDLSSKYDMVIGARRMSGHVPFLRRPAKWVLKKLASFVAGYRIPDLNSGLRIFRKDACMKFWHLYPAGFSFTSTITVGFLTHDYDVKFIPIDYFTRKGKSKIHPINDFIGFNKLILKLALFFRPLKIFIPLSSCVFLFGLGIFIYGIYLNVFFEQTFIMVTLSAFQIFVFGLIAEMIVRK